MKLEKITIEGVEYYQWVIIATEPPFINTVGDLFYNWHDIEIEKKRLAEKENCLQFDVITK